MNTLFKKTITLLFALLPILTSAEEREIITQQPEGKIVEYYTDFQNYDNLFGFMGDYHSVQKIIFADDNIVYFPNLLLQRTMPAFIKGEYDPNEKTITVDAGQWVFLFPNEKIPVALYALDNEEHAGPTPTTFYSQPLIFDVGDDDVISLRSSEAFPMFGICNANNSEEVYQNAKDLRFIPVDNIKNVAGYSYTYRFGSEESLTTTTASGYYEGDDILWIKGFVPKYPDSWVKIIKTEHGWMAESFQVQTYFSSDDPIVFASTDGSNLLTALPVRINSEDNSITAADETAIMCTATSNGQGYEIFIKYSDLTLIPTNLHLNKPVAPEFVSYELTESKEVEFIFTSEAVDSNGDALPKDRLSFRLYIDGLPYIFTPADYRWISTEMASVPYTFNNFNFFSQGGDHGERRYVYFQKLSDTIQTIGVELIYTLNGDSSASNRLIYDIASDTATNDIKDIIYDSTSEAIYYNLQGIRVDRPESGKVYIEYKAGKTTKVLF